MYDWAFVKGEQDKFVCLERGARVIKFGNDNSAWASASDPEGPINLAARFSTIVDTFSAHQHLIPYVVV